MRLLKSGETKWKVNRPSEGFNSDFAAESWPSPRVGMTAMIAFYSATQAELPWTPEVTQR